ncbi:MAG: hypothetical protein EKK42_33325 [Pseudonocardiaceae bacterium]|jgi:hypothetical protein|nr:MAG: hypothetical protein EKK42_33325 [Pseudonocardiaceae bacterium]
MRVTLVALLLMVVALVVHTASQDSVQVGAVGAITVADQRQDIVATHTHSAVFADPEHFAGDDREPAPPPCPSDRPSTHDDSGTPASRLSANGSAVSVPAVSSEPALCADGRTLVAADRSVPAFRASGVDLCTELCVSRR